jgi:hypothetical protein
MSRAKNPRSTRMSKVRVKDGDLPQDFLEEDEIQKPHVFDEAELLLGRKIKTVKSTQGKNIPDAPVIGGYDKKKGYWKYTYKKPLKARNKIIASLISMGLSQTEAHRLVSPKSKYQGDFCMSVKDEKMVERIESNVDELVSEARDIIKGVAKKAAENYRDAVNQGDLKASGKVLEFSGVFKKQSDVNVNLSFGEWLKSTQEERTIDITPQKAEG